MDAAGLLAFAERLAAVGTSNLAASDAVLVAEVATNEDGAAAETGRQMLDKTQLNVAIGRFVAA